MAKRADLNISDEIDSVLNELSKYNDLEIEESILASFSNDSVLCGLNANSLYILLNDYNDRIESFETIRGEGYIIDKEE